MDLAPRPLTLQNPAVQAENRESLQTVFTQRVQDLIATLRQQEPNIHADELQRRAEAQVENDMIPLLQSKLDEKNTEMENQHRAGFPYNEFTLALVTMVLADLPPDKMESSRCISRTRR